MKRLADEIQGLVEIGIFALLIFWLFFLTIDTTIHISQIYRSTIHYVNLVLCGISSVVVSGSMMLFLKNGELKDEQSRRDLLFIFILFCLGITAMCVLEFFIL